MVLCDGGRGTGWRSATLLQAPERSHLSLRLSPHKKIVPFQRRQSEGHQDVAAVLWDGGEGVVVGGGGWRENRSYFGPSVSQRSCSSQSLLRPRTHGRYQGAGFFFPSLSSLTADRVFFSDAFQTKSFIKTAGGRGVSEADG